ncbi:outer membrane beta-barrel protein [Vibrio sp. HN007]|uniref:outer membrane beta-barrel protein n=1 Tax=Vibrio iocasae TaxID=3098914 RepID=UPI0035D4A7BB
MNKLLLIILLITTSTIAQSAMFLSPSAGYTAGGKIENENSEHFNIESSANYNLSLTTNVDQGRLGLFYSQQDTNVENQPLKIMTRHFHFQSAVYYTTTTDKLFPYLGVSLGTTYLDASWTKSEYEFSTSVFGGLEYKFSETLALQAQLRWLGILTDSKTYSVCTSPDTTNSNKCLIKFESDWLGQVQSNMGLVIKF